jgi:hypothetical protein
LIGISAFRRFARAEAGAPVPLFPVLSCLRSGQAESVDNIQNGIGSLPPWTVVEMRQALLVRVRQRTGSDAFMLGGCDQCPTIVVRFGSCSRSDPSTVGLDCDARSEEARYSLRTARRTLGQLQLCVAYLHPDLIGTRRPWPSRARQVTAALRTVRTALRSLHMHALRRDRREVGAVRIGA